MHLLLLAACRSSAIDNASNSLSLFDVVEELKAPQFPAVLPLIQIVSLWAGGAAGSPQLQRVQIIAPDGAVIADPVTEFTPTVARHRIRVNIQFLTFAHAGEYTVAVSVKRKEASDWPAAAGTFTISVTGAALKPA